MKRIYSIAFATLLILLGAGCGIEKNKSFVPISESDHPYFGVPAVDKHQTWLKTNSYNIKLCKQCHGDNLDGGISGVSCAKCHFDSSTIAHRPNVTDCNHCHGLRGDGIDPMDVLNWAPPRALNGDTAFTSLGVGRHQFHLRTTGSIYLPISCNGCHTFPATWDAPTHMNGTVDMAAYLSFDSVSTSATKYSCAACHGRTDHEWNQP